MGKETGEYRERSRGLLTVLPGLCTDETHGAWIWVLVFFESCTFPSPGHSPGSWTASLQAKMILWSYRDGTSSQTVEEKSPSRRKGRGLNILQALSRVRVSPRGSHLLRIVCAEDTKVSCWAPVSIYVCWRVGSDLATEQQRQQSSAAQSCLTLCDPMNCSFPGSSVHGISQARILEWVAISFSRESGLPFPSLGDLSDPGIESTSPALAGRFFFFFNHWATWEAHVYL